MSDAQVLPVRVLLIGPDPERPLGGVAVAMRGYQSALEAACIFGGFVPSYRAGARGTRWRFAFRAIGQLTIEIRRLRKQGYRPIVYAHGSRWLSLLRKALILSVARALRTETMLHLHSQAIDRYLVSHLGRLFLRLCMAPAHQVCVLTPWWQQRLAQEGIDKPVFVVPNPLPPEVESMARHPQPGSNAEQAGELHLLTMTRLVEGKGVDLAIETLRALPSGVCLTVAGVGRELPSLRNLTDRLGLKDRVEFTGWVEGSRKANLFRKSDVFILPTQEDSFGMGFVEAMAYGLPVIALRWGSVEHVVPNGAAGLLVERPTPEHLAPAIQKLMDPHLRGRMGTAGRRWVLQQFGSQAIGERLRNAIDVIQAADVQRA